MTSLTVGWCIVADSSPLWLSCNRDTCWEYHFIVWRVLHLFFSSVAALGWQAVDLALGMGWSHGSVHVVTIVPIKVLFLAPSIVCSNKTLGFAPSSSCKTDFSFQPFQNFVSLIWSTGERHIRERSFKEVQFNKHLCNLSPDGFGLSAQLAILKKSLREISDLVIADRTDRGSRDLKPALRTKSTWKEAPGVSEMAGSAVCIFFSWALPQAPGSPLPRTWSPVPAPQRCGLVGPPRPPRRRRTHPAPAPAPPPRRAAPPPPAAPHARRGSGLGARGSGRAPRGVAAVAGCQV